MTGPRWTQADYDRLRACRSLDQAYAAFPNRTPEAVRAARQRMLGLHGTMAQRNARPPQTPQEQQVWQEIERIMGMAIRLQHPVDWMAAFAELRRPPQGANTGACAEADCGRYAVGRGLCATHYRRLLKVSPAGPRCQVPS